MPRVIQDNFFLDYGRAWNKLFGANNPMASNELLLGLLAKISAPEYVAPSAEEVRFATSRLWDQFQTYKSGAMRWIPTFMTSFYATLIWQQRGTFALSLWYAQVGAQETASADELVVLDEEAALDAFMNELIAAQEERLSHEPEEDDSLEADDQIEQYQPEYGILLRNLARETLIGPVEFWDENDENDVSGDMNTWE
ncbi:hypothetical protein HJFPF1_04641 [Paramyrothecium foliicola]|nr:hypothetical protein HJFPF1_04641 [Paramyrothecium foliicola]